MRALLDAFEQERRLDVAAWEEHQQELLAPLPRSLTPGRLRKPKPSSVWALGRVNAERIYMAAWRLENMRRRSDRGYSMLELLLVPEDAWRNGFGGWPASVPPISRRDAVVAATVIQWLGTNAGGAFVRRCEERIVKLQAEDDERRAARIKAEQLAQRQAAEAERRRQAGPKTRAIDLTAGTE